MKINIGDNNSIENANIGKNNKISDNNNKIWIDIIVGLIITVVGGYILYLITK